jgi:hypothetical protein
MPSDELSSALPNAPMVIKPSASRSRDRNGSKFGSRRSASVPLVAANVAAAAWPSAAAGGTELSATRKALAVIAGQTWTPYVSRHASAIPYAGQTGPRLLLLILVVACPSFPATKYARNTVVSWTKKADVRAAGRRCCSFGDRSGRPEIRKRSWASIGHLTRVKNVGTALEKVCEDSVTIIDTFFAADIRTHSAFKYVTPKTRKPNT